MILYRKNKKWNTYSDMTPISSRPNELDERISLMSKRIQTKNKNDDIDIVDISIRSSEAYHHITILYAIVDKKSIKKRI